MWETILAATIDNIFAGLNQAGLILMKLSLDETATRPKFTWFTGCVIVIAAAIVHMIALPFADMTLLSTTQATAIIAGVLLSIYWLGESFSYTYDLPALIMMLGGMTALILLANKTVSEFTHKELKALMVGKQAQIYYAIMVLAFLMTVILYCCVMRQLKAFETKAQEYIEDFA